MRPVDFLFIALVLDSAEPLLLWPLPQNVTNGHECFVFDAEAMSCDLHGVGRSEIRQVLLAACSRVQQNILKSPQSAGPSCLGSFRTASVQIYLNSPDANLSSSTDESYLLSINHVSDFISINSSSWVGGMLSCGHYF
jgi:hypothetical protein